MYIHLVDLPTLPDVCHSKLSLDSEINVHVQKNKEYQVLRMARFKKMPNIIFWL